MIAPEWSFILTAFGLTGMWLAGSGRRIGWAVGVFSQLLWLTYALVTGQHGFILSAVAYGVVQWRNFRRGRTGTAPAKGKSRRVLPAQWVAWIRSRRWRLRRHSS